jgi:hypothetical protein
MPLKFMPLHCHQNSSISFTDTTSNFQSLGCHSCQWLSSSVSLTWGPTIWRVICYCFQSHNYHSSNDNMAPHMTPLPIISNQPHLSSRPLPSSTWQDYRAVRTGRHNSPAWLGRNRAGEGQRQPLLASSVDTWPVVWCGGRGTGLDLTLLVRIWKKRKLHALD